MKKLLKIIFFALIILSINRYLFPQNKKVKVKNLDFNIENNKVLIHYDLCSQQKESEHSIRLMFLDPYHNITIPSSLNGDIGSNISIGSDKLIVWDIKNDLTNKFDKIRPVIFVDGLNWELSKFGGSDNVFFSILMPGLGDYFVADYHTLKFKPYYRTLISYGLIGMGIYLDKLRYREEGHWENMLRGNAHNSWYEEEYIEGPIHYPLFKGDKELLIAMGAAVWFYDVIWVFAKGSNNTKILSSLKKTNLSFDYNNKGLNINFFYDF